MDDPTNISPARTSLGAAVHAETLALRNDLDQARQLAAEYQRDVSQKSNDLADLKRALEKALTDLDSLQSAVGELRAERHRLANEAMRALALERRLQKIAAERDRLREELAQEQQRCSASQPVPGTAPTGAVTVERLQQIIAERDSLRAALKDRIKRCKCSLGLNANDLGAVERERDFIALQFDSANEMPEVIVTRTEPRVRKPH